MCVCVHDVCVCVCMDMLLYIRMYVCVCICVCVCVCACALMSVCTYACMYVYTHVCTCVWGCVCACLCTHKTRAFNPTSDHHPVLNVYTYVCGGREGTYVWRCTHVCVCTCGSGQSIWRFVCVCVGTHVSYEEEDACVCVGTHMWRTHEGSGWKRSRMCQKRPSIEVKETYICVEDTWVVRLKKVVHHSASGRIRLQQHHSTMCTHTYVGLFYLYARSLLTHPWPFSRIRLQLHHSTMCTHTLSPEH
jgi:hypothetical protein